MFANFSSALSIERENVMFMQRAIICTAPGNGLPLIGHCITILGSDWLLLTVTEAAICTVCSVHFLTVSLYHYSHTITPQMHTYSQIKEINKEE